MPKQAEKRRAPAICEDCGSVYTVHVLPDGTLEPIGAVACSCGSNEFQVVT